MSIGIYTGVILVDPQQPNKGDGNSAFDGDADIAYGPLLADCQWGSTQGNGINYLAEAKRVLSGILEREVGTVRCGCNGAGQQAWLNAIYDAVRSEQQGYCADTVTLLCLMVMTGNYWVSGT